MTERPGGKGLNVARVLAALGHRVTVTGFAGGTTGDVVRAGLTGVPGVTDALVPVAGATRRTIAVVDERTGDTTQLNEPGPAVSPAEWNAFQETYENLLAGAAAGGPVRQPAAGRPGERLCRAGAHRPRRRRPRAAGHQRGAAAPGGRRPTGPDQPNADELAELTGSHEPLRATQAARRRGARSVVASLGADGLLAVTPEEPLACRAARTRPRQPDRRGGLGGRGTALGLVEHLPWPDRLARAVALSAATVLAPVAGEFDRGAYEELLGRGVAVTAEAGAA